MSAVEKGRYPGQCTGEKDVKFGRASTGTEQIGLLFRMTEGEHKGKTFAWYGSLKSPESIELVRGVLEACGWDGKSWTKLGPLDAPVSLVFDEQQSEDGEVFVVLAYINRLGLGMKDELDQKARQSLLARLDKMNGAGAPVR